MKSGDAFEQSNVDQLRHQCVSFCIVHLLAHYCLPLFTNGRASTVAANMAAATGSSTTSSSTAPRLANRSSTRACKAARHGVAILLCLCNTDAVGQQRVVVCAHRCRGFPQAYAQTALLTTVVEGVVGTLANVCFEALVILQVLPQK